MSTDRPPPSTARTVLIYVAVAGVVVGVGEWALQQVWPGAGLLAQLLLGGALVGGTAVVLHRLLLRDAREVAAREAELADQARTWLELFDANPVPMWIYDTETFAFLAVNPAAVESYGWSEEAFLSRTILDIRPPEDRDRVTDYVAERADTQRSAGVWRHVDAAGRSRWVEVASLPLSYEGRATRFVMALDVTARVESERAQRTARQRLEAVLDAAPLPIMIIDGEDCVHRCNPATESTLALQRGDQLARLTGPDDSWSTLAALLDDARSDEPTRPSATLEIRVRGEARTIAVSAGRVPTEAGTGTEVVLVCTDITEREHLARQLRDLHKREAVGRLAGGIAHEFNNLLTTILGHGELIGERQPLPAETADDLAAIRAAALRAAGLVDQLLEFSRRPSTPPTPIHVEEVVDAMRSLLQQAAGAHTTVSLMLAAPDAHVVIERDRFEHLLVDLALNAGQAMPEGGQLTVSVERTTVDAPDHPELRPGPYVATTVEDDGIGMAREVAARASEPFFTTGPPGAGSGLGLATAQATIADAGGAVEIDSELGRGTAVTILLPERDAPAAP